MGERYTCHCAQVEVTAMGQLTGVGSRLLPCASWERRHQLWQPSCWPSFHPCIGGLFHSQHVGADELLLSSSWLDRRHTLDSFRPLFCVTVLYMQECNTSSERTGDFWPQPNVDEAHIFWKASCQGDLMQQGRGGSDLVDALYKQICVFPAAAVC